MFEIGKEQKEKEKEAPFEFDIEKEIKDEKSYQGYLKEIEEKKQKVQTLRREGGSKEELEKLDLLLAGYDSMKNILEVAKKKGL